MKILYLVIAILYSTSLFAQQDYHINDCLDGRTCVSVVGVDTIFTLRLAYIDTPERAQSYGSYSLFQLRGIIQGQTIQFEELSIDPVTGWRTGRMYLNGVDIAPQLLMQGAAYPVFEGMPEELVDPYNNARLIAAQGNQGVWGGGAPNLLPWMYRKIIDPIPDADGNRGSVACPFSIQVETECEVFETFEQAQFARLCGNLAIDPDNDGVACE